MARLWHWGVLLAAGLLLAGCAQWVREETRAKADFRNFQDQQRERDAYQACARRTLPGSVENLECRLRLTTPQNKPAASQ